jgi:iron(III) transport system ATP-binding protein
VSPQLLLLDEPLSALDAKVRAMLRGEIRQLQQRLGVTTIMVTHDQEEALTMADRILVLDGGRLVQEGTPRQVYDQPGTPFVARFIGAMNFIGNVRKVKEGIYHWGDTRLTVASENGSGRLPADAPVTIAIRPEDLILMPGAGAANVVHTKVVRMEYRGSQFRIDLEPTGTANAARLTADVPSEKVRRLDIREAMGLAVQLPSDRLRVYAGSANAPDTVH